MSVNSFRLSSGTSFFGVADGASTVDEGGQLGTEYSFPIPFSSNDRWGHEASTRATSDPEGRQLDLVSNGVRQFDCPALPSRSPYGAPPLAEHCA
jgi:hypothetical protein